MTIGKGYILRDLKWDTDFFGIKCARVYIITELNEEQYETLLKDITVYEFITIDNVKGSYINNQLLCQMDNCFLVDVPVTYRLCVSGCNADKNGLVIKNNVDFNEDILRIGHKAFKQGRFYKDKHIVEQKTNQLYVSWLKNAFNRTDKYYVLCDNYKGFTLFSETDDKIGLDIELIAVDESVRGKGIAKKMLLALSDYAAGHDYDYINVVTQADNLAAVNLYSGQGFRLYSCIYTFHRWKK